jgi:hypothetical protein
MPCMVISTPPVDGTDGGDTRNGTAKFGAIIGSSHRGKLELQPVR